VRPLQLISVLGGRSNGKTEVAPAPARAEATPKGHLR
jgi:hypothetical protein